MVDVLQLEQATGAFRISCCSFASNFTLCTESSELAHEGTLVSSKITALLTYATACLLQTLVNVNKLHAVSVRLWPSLRLTACIGKVETALTLDYWYLIP